MVIENIIFSDKPGYRIKRHLFFWIPYCLFFFLQSIAPNHINDLLYSRAYKNAFVSLYCFLPVCMFSVYINLYFLLPFFLQKRDYVGFALGFVLLFGLAIFINQPFALLFFKNTQVPADKINAYNTLYLALTNAQHAIVLGGFAIGIKAAKNWYIQQKENLILSKQKNRTALQLLKARIHPQFLFHSLDSLYTNIKAGSSKSPEMILNLSDQLSYILYESDEELVPLEKELIILEKLVVLDRLKNGSRRAIKLKIAGTP